MQGEHSIAELCAALRVTRSGYHAWAARLPSRRAHGNAELLALIRQARAASRLYGSPRVTRWLWERAVPGQAQPGLGGGHCLRGHGRGLARRGGSPGPLPPSLRRRGHGRTPSPPSAGGPREGAAASGRGATAPSITNPRWTFELKLN
jgi:hypothetical protein